MKALLPAAVLLALAAGTGCDRMLLPSDNSVYAPRVAGLTLGFENPSLGLERRLQERYSVRVAGTRFVDHGGLLVTLTTTSHSGQTEAAYLQRDGAVLLNADPEPQRQLPRGFPDRVSRWNDRGILHCVVGRAQVKLPGIQLADPGSDLGVWVESSPMSEDGPRKRSLYLPDLGEVETLLWKDGRWVCILRLVSRSFTDLPASGKADL